MWDPPPPSLQSICLGGHQSLLLPFAMRKSTRSSRMPCPLSYPPPHFGDHILMEMNLLAALFRAQRGGIWRAQESLSPHNVGPADGLHSVMPGAQTAPAFLSREAPKHSLKFWNLECPFFSLVVQRKWIVCTCIGEGTEAAKKLSTFRAQLIFVGFVFPRGCDPGNKSNARTVQLRQLNAGPQQSGALHYSNSAKGGKRRKDMCIMPK